MLSGKVDATLGGVLERGGRGAAPAPPAAGIVPVDRLGVPDYDELVLVANEDYVDERRDDLRLFIGAVAKGAREARADPRGAAEALLDANKDLKPDDARERAVTLPALFPESGTAPWATWTR